MDINTRFNKAMLMKEEYSEFLPFLYDIFKFQGFDLNWVQADIAEYLAKGPKRRAIFAQRGQAKTTITCMYGLWRIVQNPTCRVLIVSANQSRADQNGKLMHSLLHNWERLDYLRPDVRNRDRDSSSSFDVHYMLKGIDKSPSVVTAGITSSITGSRADVLVSDDIELPENSATPVMREKLIQSAREFAAVCVSGEIIYLGTPQTKDSIYNSLPARGVDIRIWPGRYPSQHHIEAYGSRLAPSISQRLSKDPGLAKGGGLDGTRGQVVDTSGRLGESVLREKEEEGVEFFELQYMLNTKLMDEMRQQLKLKDLIVLEASDRVPEVLEWTPSKSTQISLPNDFPVNGVTMYGPSFISTEFTTLKQRVMTVDPASEGGDEVAFACGGTAGPYIHVTDWGGLRGGMSEANLTKLVEIAEENKCELIVVERNLGGGIATSLLQAHVAKMGKSIGVSDQNSKGQKERRIIDCIAPIQKRHRLVLHRAAIDRDLETIRQYSMDRRMIYSGLYQMDAITTDRGCLLKDDRIDVLEQLCRHLASALYVDEAKAAAARDKAALQEWLDNPTGIPNFKKKHRRTGVGYIQRRFGG